MESPLSNGEIRNSKENSKWKVFYQMAKSETPRKIQKGKSQIKWQIQKFKLIKRMDNNCHISDLIQAFSYVKNGGFNLVPQLAKPLTCRTVASNCIILTTKSGSVSLNLFMTFCSCIIVKIMKIDATVIQVRGLVSYKTRFNTPFFT